MKRFTLLTFVLFAFLPSLAQKAQVEKKTYTKGGEAVHRERCSTMEADAKLREKYPDLGSLEDFQLWLNQEVAKREANPAKTNVVVTIPTIVHVIHNGEAVGSGTNISQAQINSQITVLNQDYRRTNPDASSTPATFAGVAADCEIEFCLAVVDPNGNPLAQPGIDRINRNTAGFTAPPYSMNYIDATIKPATSWDPTKYFNIWVCNLGNGLLGYAQFPNNSGLTGMNANNGAANTDGVVILYNAFGNTGNVAPPYNKGRTLTHEAGHWLGLIHIWGDDGTSCNGSDYCGDTPNQADENYGCPTFPTISCSNSGDMSMNYMDYTNDACMNLFTANQKARMQTVLSVSPRRASLTTSNACQASGGPNANFSYSPNPGCIGQAVQCTFTGSGATSYSWSFPGGTPATSTAMNPTVTYGSAGTYTATLIASNGTATDTHTGSITVINCSGGGSCDTLSNIDGNDTLAIYNSGGWGYVAGHNDYGDIAKAEFYNYVGAPVQLSGAIFGFGVGATNSPTTNIQVKVWSDNAGTPGTQLYTQNVLLQTIETDVAAGNETVVNFTTPVNITGPFYLGIQFAYAAGDTVALISNRDLNTPPPGTAWEQWSDNTWHPFSEVGTGWDLDMSLYALPILCPNSSGSTPVASFTATPTAICTGQSVTYTSTSTGNPTSYLWTFTGGSPASSTAQNPTVTYSNTGTFSASLTATNASGSNTSTQNNLITVNAAPVSSFTYTGASGNYQFSSTSTGSPTSYTWNFGDGGTSTQMNPLHSYTASGGYTVTLTVTNACGTNTSSQVIEASVGIEDEIEGEVKIYPNPNSGTFTLEVSNTNEDKIALSLFDIQGKQIFSESYSVMSGNLKKELNMSNLSEGAYFVRLSSGGKSSNYKLLIHK
ncbi:MAG: PKD domain-containing protein [Bacteroidia bacterium]|nr:PKD domain-containing protein [Bacteroidia bacterium]